MIDALDRVQAPEVLATVTGRVTRRRTDADTDAEPYLRAAWDQHARDLHAFARSLVREAETAEDLVAEAYLRLVRETHAGRRPDDPRAWLYRVTANLVMSRGRRVATARRLIGRLVDRRTSPSPEDVHHRRVLDPALQAALLALPADARVAIVMAARGATGAEIAAAIGRTEAATRTLLTRARQRLRARLDAEGER